MNYMNQIAQMLGVELDEEFYLEDITDGCYVTYDEVCYVTCDEVKTVFKLSNSGMLRKDKRMVSGWINSTYPHLLGLLIGRYTIVKNPWKPSHGLRYYYVGLDKTLGYTIFDSECYWDVLAYTLGNCFRTKEEITPEVLEETWQKCYGAYFQDDKQDGAHQ